METKRTRPDTIKRNIAGAGYGNPRNRACKTPMGIFHSLSLAAKAHGVSRQRVYARINSNRPNNVNWCYVDAARDD